MGLYDTLELPDGLTLPGLDRDPATVDWQTKSIDRPAMGTYRITVDGRLLEEEFHTEHVPEEERPFYGTEEWEDPLFKMAGSIRTVHDAWSERNYHGIVEFSATVDGSVVRYEARFTEGLVEAIRQTKPDETDWQAYETLVEGTADPTVPDPRLTPTQVIHLRAILDDLESELDELEDPDAGSTGGLDGRGTVRVQRARRAVESLDAYLDWRADTME